MPETRTLVRGAVLVVVALVLFVAYRRATYEPGQHTQQSLNELVAYADELLAGKSSGVKAEVKSAIEAGDIDRVRRALEPIAAQLGKLEEMKRVLNGMASPQAPAQPVPTERGTGRPQQQTPTSRAREVRSPQPLPPEPPPPIYRVAATQPNWAEYDGPVPNGAFKVKAEGWLRSPVTKRGDLVVSEAPRFAPLLRLCYGPECHLTVFAEPAGGGEYETLICKMERGKFDRVEIWYNDYSDAPKEQNTGFLNFTLEANDGGGCVARELCLNMIRAGVNKPSSCR